MNTLFKTILLTLTLLLLVACGGESRSKTPPPNRPDSNVPDSLGGGTAEGDNSTNTNNGTSNGINEPHETSASIDVLVLYDNDVAEDVSNVSALVHHYFAVANSAYADSGLNININVVGIVPYNASTHPALEEISASEKVASLREEYHADTVLLYQILRDVKAGDLVQCGVAYSAKSYEKENLFKGGMFAQVEINCPSNTTVHELGHNMGLTHSHLQNGDEAVPYSYGLGHGINEKFTTIMAYGYLFDTEYEVLRFSSPDYECLPGYPCGIAVGQPGEAHASKVIQYTAPKIANLY